MPEQAHPEHYNYLCEALFTWQAGRYEFTRNATQYCLQTWEILSDDLRMAVVRHLQNQRLIFKKNPQHREDNRLYFHANIELCAERDVYVDLSFKGNSPVRINAHNHHPFPILDR